MEAFIHSDLELVRAFLGGAHGHFDMLLARYEGKLFRLSRRLLGDENGATRVLEAVAVRAYEQCHEGAFVPNVCCWLYRETIGEINRMLWERVFDAERASALASDSGAHRSPLDRALMRLPLDYRKIYLLRDAHGLTDEDVSQIVLRPVDEVEGILHRARLMLRRTLVRSGTFLQASSPVAPGDESAVPA